MNFLISIFCLAMWFAIVTHKLHLLNVIYSACAEPCEVGRFDAEALKSEARSRVEGYFECRGEVSIPGNLEHHVLGATHRPANRVRPMRTSKTLAVTVLRHHI